MEALTDESPTSWQYALGTEPVTIGIPCGKALRGYCQPNCECYRIDRKTAQLSGDQAPHLLLAIPGTHPAWERSDC